MDEGELLLDLSASRLRAHARWAGVACLLAGLMPWAVVEGKTQFLWQFLPDATGPQGLLALASPLAGAALVAASWRCRSASSLAWTAIGALALLPLLVWSGVACDGEVSLVFFHRSAPAAAAVALALAGMAAGSEPEGRRAGGGLLAASGAVAALYLLWPWPDAPLLVHLGRLATLLAAHPTRALPAALALACVALWPLGVLLYGAHELRARPPAPPPARLLFLGAPTILLPAATRSLLGQRGGSGDLAVAAGEALVLGALLTLLARAVLFLVRWGGRVERRTAMAAALLGAAALAAPWALAPRREPRVWATDRASPAAERFFRETLPAWNDQRRRLDLEGHGAAPTGELLAAARAIDPGLGEAVAALVREAGDPELTLQRWSRRIEAINARSRGAGLPYLTDATGKVIESDDPSRRWFRLDTYRVDGARQFGGAAALHLRALTPRRTSLGLLGLSRDRQPFALVVLDAIDIHASEMARLAALTPPRCADGHASGAVEDALLRCGEMLRGLEASTGEALLRSVERHELQHQLDGARLGTAAVVARRLPWSDADIRAEINRELSAYLAEMTAPGDAPRVTLARLLRFLVLHRHGNERLVALLAFEALGGHDSSLAASAAVFQELAALGSDALRARAAGAWRAQYGRALP